MVDVRKIVFDALNELDEPVYNEHFLTNESEIPCISYRLSGDVQQETGEHLMYSRVNMSIKIWAKSLKDITEISNKVDKKMRSIGFTRTSTNELWINEICQYELRYNAKALEVMED